MDRSKYIAAYTCNDQPRLPEIVFDFVPGIEQQMQILARLQRTHKQDIARRHICSDLFRGWVKKCMIHTIWSDDHIFDSKSLYDFAFYIVRRCKHNSHMPCQNREEQTIPGSETRSKPFWMFQRAQVMNRQCLLSKHQRAAIGRRPQDRMSIQLPGKEELLPCMTSQPLQSRRCDPRFAPDITKDLTPMAFHAGDTTRQEPSVHYDVTRHGAF